MFARELERERMNVLLMIFFWFSFEFRVFFLVAILNFLKKYFFRTRQAHAAVWLLAFYGQLGLLVPCLMNSYFSYNSPSFFFMDEFQWFFIELSVLPIRNLAISAHLLPKALCAKNNSHSSYSFQSSFLMAGFKWLCHLSRHCFPIRPSLIILYLVDSKQ